jgi:hypothetical protein
MPKFNNAKDLERHLKKAMDTLQFEVIKTTQAQLGSTDVSPWSTGRLRSSWFAAEGQASSEVAPEGTDKANEDATGLRVDSSKTYHLTNNLPYAQPIALGVNLPPSWGGKARAKSRGWFTLFRDETIPQIQRDTARAVKRHFDL